MNKNLVIRNSNQKDADECTAIFVSTLKN